jgi:hypothetical protein
MYRYGVNNGTPVVRKDLNYTVDFKTALANRLVFYAEDEASY